MSEFKKYIDYIKNAGGNPKVAWFDEDWMPIGPAVRKKMNETDLTREGNGEIFLMPKGGF